MVVAQGVERGALCDDVLVGVGVERGGHREGRPCGTVLAAVAHGVVTGLSEEIECGTRVDEAA